MMTDISEILKSFETGEFSRRETIKKLSFLLLAVAGISKNAFANPEEISGLFKSVGLNHIGLRVTDVARSRDFYMQQLGLSVIRDNSPNFCFLQSGDNYLGLFRAEESRLDHFCFTINNYDADKTFKKLKVAGFQPKRQENRVYFKDPDGIELQVSGKWDSWPGPPPSG